MSGRVPVSRRTLIKRLGAAGAALSGAALSPQWSLAQESAAAYSRASIDWRQFAGQKITLAGAIHPWSSAIKPLLPQFTELTGIEVVTDFQLETTYLGALPIQLASGGRTPDVFMFLTYGQGISSGWLESLNTHYADRSLTDLTWSPSSYQVRSVNDRSA